VVLLFVLQSGLIVCRVRVKGRSWGGGLELRGGEGGEIASQLGVRG